MPPCNEDRPTRRLTLTLCLAVGLGLATAGCWGGSASRETGGRTVGDFVDYLRKNGVEGEYKPGMAGALGDVEGGSYEGKGVKVSVMRFADESRAKSLEKSGAYGLTCHRNGLLVMAAREGEDRVLPLFRKF